MAVFTPVSDDQAREFVGGYPAAGEFVSLHAIAEGVENTNYRLETTTGRFVLTLFEGRTDAASLPFCLGLTDHLAVKAYPAARPLRDLDGKWIGTLNGRPAAVVEWLEARGIALKDAASPREILGHAVAVAEKHGIGRRALSNFDCFHYAHAKVAGAPLLTLDQLLRQTDAVTLPTG